jgi:hypothetical protein
MPAPSLALADYAKQAAALDFIVAFQKTPKKGKADFGVAVLQQVLSGRSGYDAIAAVAHQTYKIKIDPDVLRRYVALLRTPTSNAAVSAFLQRVDSNPALKKQILSSASSYEALQRVVSANGLAVAPLDLQNYLAPWQLLANLLKGLLNRKVITEKQFQEHAGFASRDSSLSGYGPDIDQEIMDALLSAAGWATKLPGFGNLKVPVAAIIFPSTAIIMGGFEGQSFTFSQIGDMFAQSFSLALEHMMGALDAFQDSVSSIFS